MRGRRAAVVQSLRSSPQPYRFTPGPLRWLDVSKLSLSVSTNVTNDPKVNDSDSEEFNAVSTPSSNGNRSPDFSSALDDSLTRYYSVGERQTRTLPPVRLQPLQDLRSLFRPEKRRPDRRKYSVDKEPFMPVRADTPYISKRDCYRGLHRRHPRIPKAVTQKPPARPTVEPAKRTSFNEYMVSYVGVRTGRQPINIVDKLRKV